MKKNNNSVNNVLEVNGQNMPIPVNQHNANYHMTIETMRVLQPEKYDILKEYFALHSNLKIESGFAKISTPVVDITTGKIYPNLALGKNTTNLKDYFNTRMRVVHSIEREEPFKGYKKLTDFEGNDINNHTLMFVEDVPIAILREYLRIAEITKKEEKKAKRLKK